nr:putative B3 domain-containing protein At1g05615 [Coffea arabica]
MIAAALRCRACLLDSGATTATATTTGVSTDHQWQRLLVAATRAHSSSTQQPSPGVQSPIATKDSHHGLTWQQQLAAALVAATSQQPQMINANPQVKQIHGKEKNKRLRSNKSSIRASTREDGIHSNRIKFKKWYMGNSEVYVLVSGWNEVVKRNGLKPETPVQLWSFKKDSQLYFVLVRLQWGCSA